MCRVEGVAHPENPAESVVALLAALGSSNVAALGTRTLTTVGLKAWKPAKVSAKLIND